MIGKNQEKGYEKNVVITIGDKTSLEPHRVITTLFHYLFLKQGIKL